MRVLHSLTSLLCAAGLLGGCAVAKTTGKVAALPFKAVNKTGKYTAKSIYYTGKGVYNVAKIPIKVTDAALDTTVKVLTVTTQVVDLSGKIVSITRTMQRSEIDGYIRQAKGAANIVSILVDVFKG